MGTGVCSIVLMESGTTHGAARRKRARFCCHVSLMAFRPSSGPGASAMCSRATLGRVITRSTSLVGSASPVT